MSATVVGTVLSRSEWESRAEAHRARVAPQVTGVIERRARGEKHPVEDFLFHYYTLRPSHLLHWNAGVGHAVEGGEELLDQPFHAARTDGSVALDVEGFLAKRGRTVATAERLLRASAAATPRFGCFGMHEWAMVYRLDQGETPPLFVVGPLGQSQLVNYRVSGNHYIVDRLFGAAELRLGENPQQIVRIVRTDGQSRRARK